MHAEARDGIAGQVATLLNSVVVGYGFSMQAECTGLPTAPCNKLYSMGEARAHAGPRMADLGSYNDHVANRGDLAHMHVCFSVLFFYSTELMILQIFLLYKNS
jgi:hypothetical protein